MSLTKRSRKTDCSAVHQMRANSHLSAKGGRSATETSVRYLPVVEQASGMTAGKVNETLSKQFSYKGDDGLSDAERHAYEACRPLSCLHEACYKRYMYSPPQKQKEKCGALMDNTGKSASKSRRQRDFQLRQRRSHGAVSS